MKTIYSFLLLCCFLLVSCSEPPIQEFHIIPQPQNINYIPGEINLDNKVTIAYSDGLENEAELLSSYLKSDFNIQSELAKGNKGDIILAIDPSVMADKKEAYQLDMSKRKVLLKSSDAHGVMNGIQTFRQTIRQEEGKTIIQKALINDYPAFGWRALLLDEARYFKGKQVVLDLLDRMSELKVNVFHWHLTDDQGWRIEIKKYPKLTEIGAFRDSTEITHFGSEVFDGKPHGGFYTQDDIREIVKYAADRHISIVPEIEMPGHGSAAIASYPWLGTSGKQIKVPCKFGVHYNAYNVSDPKVLQFLEDVIDEVITLFPSPVIHIGGDEVRYDPWKSSAQVKKYMKENKIDSYAGLQVFFTNNISNLLASKNRRMMGWNEITGAQVNDYQQDGSGESKHKLAPGTIVHFWKGEPKLIKEAIKDGYDVVNSYHKYTYVDYSYESIPLEKSYSFNPVPEGLTEAEQKKVLGLGCQMWGEFIPTVDNMNSKIFPRIAAYAETGWSGEKNKDYNRFLTSLKGFLKKWSDLGIKPGPVETPSK